MKIVLRSGTSDKWHVVNSASYGQERELQRILAEAPNLIPVEELRDDASPLMVAIREFGLPGSGNTDILAFSADGDIALLECKLESNADIKRTVIGQIFEYAAYLSEMDYETLNDRVRQQRGEDLTELVRASLGSTDWDEEAFRSGVTDCLEQGRFMLIIGVDRINEELSKTVRFINGFGHSSFSLHALEMQRYAGEGVEILVPHLHGPTRVSRPSSERRQWTWERFLSVAQAANASDVVAAMKDLYEWSRSIGARAFFGNGKVTGSFTFHCLKEGRVVSIFSVYTDGKLWLNFGYLRNVVPDEAIREFHTSLLKIEPFRRLPANYGGFPSVPLRDVAGQAGALDQFRQEVARFMTYAGVDNGG